MAVGIEGPDGNRARWPGQSETKGQKRQSGMESRNRSISTGVEHRACTRRWRRRHGWDSAASMEFCQGQLASSERLQNASGVIALILDRSNIIDQQALKRKERGQTVVS